METASIAEREKPLARQKRMSLMMCAGAILLLAYLYICIGFLWVALLILLEVVACVVGLQVFVVVILAKPLDALVRLGYLIRRSLTLDQGADWSIGLPMDAAPALHDLIADVAKRMDVHPPSKVEVDLSATAGICLDGMRRGWGETRLALSYQFLSLLDVDELETVIAHELAHAKLIPRGYNRWVNRGIARFRRLSLELERFVSAYRTDSHRFYTAEFLAIGLRPIAMAGIRLVSACSRQDEFDADMAAARLCGSQVCRDALVREAILTGKDMDHSWRELTLQVQRGILLSDWFRSTLAPVDDDERATILKQLMDPKRHSGFDSHPALEDRLAALPEGTPRQTNDQPALTLLSDPNDIASRLVAQIEAMIGKQENQEAALIRRSAKRRASDYSHHLTPGQFVGLAIGLVGFCPFVGYLAMALTTIDFASRLSPMCVCVAVMLIGLIVGIRFRYRDRLPMSVPSFSAWRSVMRSDDCRTDIAEWYSEVEAALKTEASLINSRRGRARYWGSRCYQALQECDFRRALAASRLCLADHRHCPEGQLGNGVAAAYFDLKDEAEKSINRFYAKHGLTPASAWAFGWAFSMMHDHRAAMAYLLEAAQCMPASGTTHSILGLSLWECGKSRAAIEAVEKAVELEPQECQHRALLSLFLLFVGRLADGRRELEIAEQHIPDDWRVMYGWVVLSLISEDRSEADRRAELIVQAYPGDETYSALSDAYAGAGDEERSCEFRERARELQAA